MNLLDGLVSYWKFDETSGTTSYDAVGSNDGTITGATINQTGKINTAYDFDGTDDNVSISYPVDYKTGNFSVSLWAIADANSGTDWLWSFVQDRYQRGICWNGTQVIFDISRHV
jgi:hypothetical protein